MSAPKKGRLLARWSKAENDFLYSHPSIPDGHLIHQFLHHAKLGDKSLREELESRGYDLTTLRFSVDRKTGIK